LGDKLLQHGVFSEVDTQEDQWTTDIVLIVEAKECNKDLKNTKHIGQFFNILNLELLETNITKNRQFLTKKPTKNFK